MKTRQTKLEYKHPCGKEQSSFVFVATAFVQDSGVISPLNIPCITRARSVEPRIVAAAPLTLSDLQSKSLPYSSDSVLAGDL